MSNSMDCGWLERVSALLDHELSPIEAELVKAHASTCASCRAIMNFDHDLSSKESAIGSNNTVGMRILATRPKIARVLLGLSGLVMVLFAVSSFVRGSRGGDDLHDLRHLGIWQASLGVSLVAVCLSFRMSLFLVSIAASFLLLTVAATVIDLVLGHRGPWADLTHLVEILATGTLLVLVRPRIQLLSRRPRQCASFRAKH